MEIGEDAAASLRSDISQENLSSQAADSKSFASGRALGGSMPQMMGGEEAKKSFENMVTKKKGG